MQSEQLKEEAVKYFHVSAGLSPSGMAPKTRHTPVPAMLLSTGNSRSQSAVTANNPMSLNKHEWFIHQGNTTRQEKGANFGHT